MLGDNSGSGLAASPWCWGPVYTTRGSQEPAERPRVRLRAALPACGASRQVMGGASFVRPGSMLLSLSLFVSLSLSPSLSSLSQRRTYRRVASSLARERIRQLPLRLFSAIRAAALRLGSCGEGCGCFSPRSGRHQRAWRRVVGPPHHDALELASPTMAFADNSQLRAATAYFSRSRHVSTANLAARGEVIDGWLATVICTGAIVHLPARKHLHTDRHRQRPPGDVVHRPGPPVWYPAALEEVPRLILCRRSRLAEMAAVRRKERYVTLSTGETARWNLLQAAYGPRPFVFPVLIWNEQPLSRKTHANLFARMCAEKSTRHSDALPIRRPSYAASLNKRTPDAASDYAATPVKRGELVEAVHGHGGVLTCSCRAGRQTLEDGPQLLLRHIQRRWHPGTCSR